jgi:hypothetical protein
MIAIAAVVFALPIEFGLSAGIANAETISESVRAPMFQARVGVDVLDLLSLNATVLGSAQPDPVYPGCCAARNPSSLRAISGLATLRLHSSGDVQGFVELGGGPGHLIELTPALQFENPAMRGRGGFSWLLGAGGRWFVARTVAFGAELQWIQWTNVGVPAFTYGVENRPATTTTQGALALMLSVDFAPFR